MSLYKTIHGVILRVCIQIFFHSVDYFSDESSSSTASGNAGGGGESDSDSSYCPTSDSCESETVVKEGPVLGSIVIHPLVLQLMEPVTSSRASLLCRVE